MSPSNFLTPCKCPTAQLIIRPIGWGPFGPIRLSPPYQDAKSLSRLSPGLWLSIRSSHNPCLSFSQRWSSSQNSGKHLLTILLVSYKRIRQRKKKSPSLSSSTRVKSLATAVTDLLPLKGVQDRDHEWGILLFWKNRQNRLLDSDFQKKMYVSSQI